MYRSALAAALLALGLGRALADNPSTAFPPVASHVTSKAAWTPADNSGASLSLTVNAAMYVRRGDLVTILFSITYPTTASSASAQISGLPVAIANSAYNHAPGLCWVHGGAGMAMFVPTLNTSTGVFADPTTGAALANSALTGRTLDCSVTYSAT